MDTEKPDLQTLPIHSLRSALKERGIHFKLTDKKPDLIKMLEKGETTHIKEEPKRKETLQESVADRKKALPVVPKEIRPQLEEYATKGLEWTIDEESGCINFKRGAFQSCANLDQPANNILTAVRECFPRQAPIEQGRTDQRIEWA